MTTTAGAQVAQAASNEPVQATIGSQVDVSTAAEGTEYVLLVSEDLGVSWREFGRQIAHGPTQALAARSTEQILNTSHVYRAVAARSWGDALKLKARTPLVVSKA